LAQDYEFLRLLLDRYPLVRSGLHDPDAQ